MNYFSKVYRIDLTYLEKNTKLLEMVRKTSSIYKYLYQFTKGVNIYKLANEIDMYIPKYTDKKDIIEFFVHNLIYFEHIQCSKYITLAKILAMNKPVDFLLNHGDTILRNCLIDLPTQYQDRKSMLSTYIKTKKKSIMLHFDNEYYFNKKCVLLTIDNKNTYYKLTDQTKYIKHIMKHKDWELSLQTFKQIVKNKSLRHRDNTLLRNIILN